MGPAQPYARQLTLSSVPGDLLAAWQRTLGASSIGPAHQGVQPNHQSQRLANGRPAKGIDTSSAFALATGEQTGCWSTWDTSLPQPLVQEQRWAAGRLLPDMFTMCLEVIGAEWVDSCANWTGDFNAGT